MNDEWRKPNPCDEGYDEEHDWLDVPKKAEEERAKRQRDKAHDEVMGDDPDRETKI